MTKTTHTPGPWTAIPSPSGDHDLIFNSTGKMTIATCGWPAGIQREVIAANAKLIAAAPSLKAALMPFASLAIRGCGKCDGSGKDGATDQACHQCGGVGEIVVGFPHPDDVIAAKAILSTL